MAKWILSRLFESKDQPIPRFAYQSTVNWMGALSIVCGSELFSSARLKHFYRDVQRRNVNKEGDTWAYENILMALHNVAALNEMNENSRNYYSIVRSAIIAWYYTIYYSSSAMIAAASGSKQTTHAGTAKVWHDDIVIRGLAVGPFGLFLNTLVTKDVKNCIDNLRNGNDFKLVNSPQNETEAWGAVYSYLSGTAEYEKWRVEERVKASKEFKKLDVSNFKTKKAQKLRDSQLESGFVNFLVQSYRYRLKANYKDSIYLSYGEDRTNGIKLFVKNLDSVASTFFKMVCYYLSRRVEKGTWTEFVDDLNQNLKLDIDFNILRVQ